jgi:hypothetical protein
MANTNGLANTFKRELLCGSHALGTQAANAVRTTTTKDVLKAALFLASATIGPSTTAYTTTGELAGTGNYTQGGVTITNATNPTLTSTTGHWTPSASFSWTNLTSSGAFDAVQIYNDSSTGKLTIAVATFSSQSITAGNFNLTMPTDNDTTGLIRLA